MFTAFFSSSSFETPDMLTVFRLSWIAIIVVVKARAGVVFPPQAMEHGRHTLWNLVPFHHCEKNIKSTHALRMTDTRPVSISTISKSFQLLL